MILVSTFENNKSISNFFDDIGNAWKHMIKGKATAKFFIYSSVTAVQEQLNDILTSETLI